MRWPALTNDPKEASVFFVPVWGHALDTASCMKEQALWNHLSGVPAEVAKAGARLGARHLLIDIGRKSGETCSYMQLNDSPGSKRLKFFARVTELHQNTSIHGLPTYVRCACLPTTTPRHPK